MSFLSRLFGRGSQTSAPQAPPAAPPALTMRVSAWGAGADGRWGLQRPDGGRLQLDDPRQLTATVEDGRLRFALPPDVPYGWHARLLVDVPATGELGRTLTFEVTLAADVDVDLPPVVTPAAALSVAGKFFCAGGRPHTIIGCSDFRLLHRWLTEGAAAVVPVLQQRRDLGFNQLRIWSMCGFLFRLDPRERDEYYVGLRDCLRTVVDHGFHVELTVFVDVDRPELALDQAAQLSHYHQTIEVLHGDEELTDAALLELVNENDVTFNKIDVRRFPHPGVIASAGSNGADASPVTPVWDYGLFHPDRPADWPRKVGHNAMEWADTLGVPVVSNENCRPDQGRGPIPADFFDAAANAALLCAGATFHSEAGKQSQLLQNEELACAQAWVAGATAIPLEFQRGSYIAGHLAGFPVDWSPVDSSRAHGRQLGTRACLSLPQLRAGYLPLGVGGWRVVSQTGSVVICER